jgi:hypothetical protein
MTGYCLLLSRSAENPGRIRVSLTRPTWNFVDISARKFNVIAGKDPYN